MNAPDLSVIVPVFNEEDSLAHFLATVRPVLDGIGLVYEIVFVDDGSRDATPSLIALAAQEDVRVRGFLLSRNFGKEAALSCGLDNARGRAVVVMDVDLQDPPNLVPEMVSLWEKGSDVVLAVRNRRDDDSWFKRNSAKAFYSMIARMTKVEIVPNAGDFRLMDRKVVEAIKRLPERSRFMKGVMSWPGFRTVSVFYARPPRAKGTSKWGFWKLWNFALDGIFSFSSIPLRIWTYVGAFIALASFAYGTWIVVRTLVHGIDTPGYASLVTLLVMLNGLVMLSNGIQGEYIARIFEEVKGRPLYIVREEIEKTAETKTR